MSPRTIVGITTDVDGVVHVACDDGTVLWFRDRRGHPGEGQWHTLPPVPGTVAAYGSDPETTLATTDEEDL